VTLPPWEVVLFDLDGTLADTIPLIVDSYRHATRRVLGTVPATAEIRGWIGRPLVDTFRELEPSRADELVEAYLSWNLANLRTRVQQYPGVSPLLRSLETAGVRSGIVTSKRRESAELTLDAAP
jgi:pyrophosphatase PpaX